MFSLAEPELLRTNVVHGGSPPGDVVVATGLLREVETFPVNQRGASDLAVRKGCSREPHEHYIRLDSDLTCTNMKEKQCSCMRVEFHV